MKKTTNLIAALAVLGGSLGFTSTVNAQDKQTNPVGLLKMEASKAYNISDSQQVLREVLQSSEEVSFQTIRQEQDGIGYTHQRMQQFYDGVKVEFGTVILHAKEGIVETISSEFYNISDVNVTPRLSNVDAFTKAINHIGAQKYMWEFPDAALEMDGYQKPEGELVILPNFSSGRDVEDINSYNLAYKFDIFATYPMSRGNLYIDAMTGEALLYDAIIKHATNFGHVGEKPATVATEIEFCASETTVDYSAIVAGTAATRYSGSQTIETRLSGGDYILEDTGRDIYTRDALNQAPGTTYPYVNNYQQFTDNDNNWTTAEHSANKDNAALDAHWGAIKTYDYWQSEHNRDSYNGSGAQIRSYVHVDNNYDNAFWNGSVMSYGDGSSNGNEGNGFFDALTSIDVAAHEIGHAVTTFTANLAYQRESGGLNEGFSDIWGAAVEHYAKGNGNDANPAAEIWLIGDEIDRRSGSPALRSMSNPTSLSQPDTYGGSFWQNPNCGTPTRANDYCGVHTNSGVLNYWFYLAVVGGNGTNDIGNAFSVSGIGMDKSAAIAYRTLNNYLGANSTFANARSFSIQAATDLYGAGGAEEQAVTNAWHAVGVGAAYAGGGGGSYCASASTNTNDEYISRVQLGTINNASGAQFYSDFTNVSTDLTEGQSYTITITPTWTGTTYNEGYGVWIDYNDDQDFDDSGEQVASIAPTQNTPVTASFTVPSGTAGVATRMRVSMSYNATPTQCQSFTYGEVEDYTVNLGGATADTEAPSNPTSLTASNLADTSVSLSWNASTDNVAVTSYDVYSGNTVIGNVAATATDVTGLTVATGYSFRVRAKDAAGNVSGYSNTVNVTTTGGGGGSGCTGGVSLPYAESFESGFGSWTQSSADDIDWSRDSGGTPSGSTGPSAGSPGAWYVFVEASGSGTGYPDKRAILNSPCFDLSGESAANFSFNYHMYGAADMGSIAVEASDNNGASWTSLWSETGNQGNSWLTANVDMSAYVGGSVQLRFNRLTGSTWQADIALDNVQMSAGGGNSGCAGGVSLPYAESYESSIGAWTQSSADDIDWSRDNGGTPSGSTGPSAGSPGSWYMYVEASGNGTGYPNKRAILNSPCLDLSGASDASFNFNYHMYGATDMGSIALELSDNDGASWTSVWSETGNKGNSWLSASVDLSAYVGGGVQLRFNRVTGSTWQADIAIDNISVTVTNTFQGIVGGQNPINSGVQFSMYPNPVKGSTLTVEVLGATPTDYIVYNVVGQVVAKGVFTNAVDVANLESGMYIMKVNTETESFVKRFVKE